MSSAVVIAIAVGAFVVLAAIAFVTMARRHDVRGAGALAAETRKRDEAARRARTAAESGATRAEGSEAAGGVALLTAEEAERAGQEARRPSTALVKPAPTAPEPWSPPDPEVIGVSRRQFFNRASVTLMAASITTFTAAGFIAFLWPSSAGGFGQVVRVGKLDDIRAGARANFGFFYAPSARTWITEYPADALPEAEAVYDEAIYRGMQDWGLVALYQKCPHLGCRVPNCDTSRWFECPCHGSQYNQVGEKKGGPAPRGMDHFVFLVDAGGNVDVDTGTVFEGPPIGTNTTGQEAEGPHCITEGGEH